MTQSADLSADRLVIEAVGGALSALAALSALPASPPLPALSALPAVPALASNARIAVAFSGGIDSSVLLDAVVRYVGASRCVALHIHHGLSANADSWRVHCEAFAQERNVEFAALRVDVSREAGVSVEAAARDARYRALETLCVERDLHTLWLGQHADDQAETVLLQLLRGAGLAGLSAMAPQYRPTQTSVLRVRPLLHLLRAQIEQYASARNLRWIDDESNADTRYARNALRHDVLPALAIHFPGFRDALARTAAHAASSQHLLDELARIDMAAAAGDEHYALSLATLLAFEDARALNLLRYWIRMQGLPAASTARLSDALRQLRDIGIAGDGHRLRVDHAGQALRSYRGQLYWEAGDSTEAADETALTRREAIELQWQGESVWRLPSWRGTFVFADTDPATDPDAIPVSVLTRARLSARSRRGGERMRVSAANSPSRTLKNLFQERGVPAWKRDVPLLFAGDDLLFVPLVGVNRAALPSRAVQAGERHLSITWREDLLIA